MSAPDDDLVEAVARAINSADNEWAGAPRTAPHEPWPHAVARAVLSVPALRDALARDAQVREIVQSMRTATVQGDVWAVVGRLAALYPESEVASMLRDGKGVDNSDIMPGSEFDGPVVL